MVSAYGMEERPGPEVDGFKDDQEAASSLDVVIHLFLRSTSISGPSGTDVTSGRCHHSPSVRTWATQVTAQSSAPRMRFWNTQTQGSCGRVHTTHAVSVTRRNVGLHTGGPKDTRLWKKPFRSSRSACAQGQPPFAFCVGGGEFESEAMPNVSAMLRIPRISCKCDGCRGPLSSLL